MCVSALAVSATEHESQYRTRGFQSSTLFTGRGGGGRCVALVRFYFARQAAGIACSYRLAFFSHCLSVVVLCLSNMTAVAPLIEAPGHWSAEYKELAQVLFDMKVPISAQAYSNYQGSGGASLAGAPCLEHAAAVAVKNALAAIMQSDGVPTTRAAFTEIVMKLIALLDRMTLQSLQGTYWMLPTESGTTNLRWWNSDVASISGFEAMRGSLLLALRKCLFNLKFIS